MIDKKVLYNGKVGRITFSCEGDTGRCYHISGRGWSDYYVDRSEFEVIL